MANVEAKLGSNGRILIRESGTEPLLRIMVEASQDNLASEYASYLAESLS
jgi:phosphoglucosamine mutase